LAFAGAIDDVSRKNLNTIIRGFEAVIGDAGSGRSKK
jgi:hypothetical protein